MKLFITGTSEYLRSNVTYIFRAKFGVYDVCCKIGFRNVTEPLVKMLQLTFVWKLDYFESETFTFGVSSSLEKIYA